MIFVIIRKKFCLDISVASLANVSDIPPRAIPCEIPLSTISEISNHQPLKRSFLLTGVYISIKMASVVSSFNASTRSFRVPNSPPVHINKNFQ